MELSSLHYYEVNTIKKIKLAKKIKKKAKQYASYLGILVALFLLLLLFKINILEIFLIIILLAVGSVSKFYKRFTTMSVGVELVTIIVILFAYKIGIVFAIIAALFMTIISEFISGKFVANSVMNQSLAYIVMSSFVGIASGLPFISLALAAIIIRNVSIIVIGILAFGAPPVKILPASIINIFFNWLLITGLGTFLVTLL